MIVGWAVDGVALRNREWFHYVVVGCGALLILRTRHGKCECGKCGKCGECGKFGQKTKDKRGTIGLTVLWT